MPTNMNALCTTQMCVRESVERVLGIAPVGHVCLSAQRADNELDGGRHAVRVQYCWSLDEGVRRHSCLPTALHTHTYTHCATVNCVSTVR
jgi:hypothetical protein